MDADPAEAIFGTEDYDLYSALHLTSSASTEEIKKAYRKLALLNHPDKLASASVEKQEQGKTVFQQIGYAYAVLNDGKRKEVYDSTGRTDEGAGGNKRTREEWDDYFRELWKGEVNATSIQDFFKAYEGSPEEKADLHKAYNESKGSITIILETVMASDALTAEERFTALINAAITAKELKSLPAWSKMLKDTKAKEKRMKEASKEAGEAEALAKELGVHDKLYGKGGKGKGKKDKEAEGEEALRALIQQRGAARMANTLASIEAKYATADNKKSKKRKSLSPSDNSEEEREKRKKAKRMSMPTEEDFQKIQAGLGKKGRKST